MRILQVSPFFSPQMGGSPQVVYHTARELTNRGHQVTVVAGDFRIREAAFPAENFSTIILPSLISKWGFYFTPALVPWIKSHIHDFDVVHLHEARTFQNIVVRMAAVRAKVPFVLSAHGTLPIIVQRQFLKQAYDFLFGWQNLAKAEYLVAISDVEANQYKQFGIRPDHIRVIHNGLYLEEFRQLPPKGDFKAKLSITSPNPKIILYLGRLHQRKGIDYLIRSFSNIKANLKDTFLIIVGPDDGALKKLQALTHELGLQDSVVFPGPLYGIKRLSALQDADVLAYPAIHEYFGLVPFEALMCGTPVIVSDDCGAGQIIGDVGAGYLVPYGDMEYLTQTLQRALTSPQENQQMISNGQCFIRENLDWKKIAQQVEDLYADCLMVT